MRHMVKSSACREFNCRSSNGSEALVDSRSVGLWFLPWLSMPFLVSLPQLLESVPALCERASPNLNSLHPP